MNDHNNTYLLDTSPHKSRSDHSNDNSYRREHRGNRHSAIINNNIQSNDKGITELKNKERKGRNNKLLHSRSHSHNPK